MSPRPAPPSPAQAVRAPADVRGSTQTNDEALALIFAELRELRQAVESLRPLATASAGLVGVATLAAELGVSRRFVYEHRDELGAVRLGDGPKARIRFDLEAAKAGMACSASKRSQGVRPNSGGGPARRTAETARRLPNGVPKPGSILSIRPREAA